MFNRTKPQTLHLGLVGLGRLIHDLTQGEGLAQYAFRGETLHVRENGQYPGRFVVFLSREQTRYLLSRLPEVNLEREYDEPVRPGTGGGETGE